MKRPLLWAFGASILGEILAYQYPEAGVAWMAAGLCLSALFLVCVRRKGRWLLLPVFFLIGFAGMLRTDRISPLGAFLETEGDSVKGEVTGRVEDIRRSAGGFKIQLSEVCFCSLKGEEMHGDGLLLYADTYPEAEPGDRVRAKGTCRAFEGASNPGQFDRQSYYRALYIEGIFFPDTLSVTDFGAEGMKKFLYRLRMGGLSVLDEIGALAPYDGWQDTMGLLAGILLGERSEIPAEISKALSAGGLSHMAAVSGLHISLIGMGLFRLLKKRAALPYPAAVFGSVWLVIGYGGMVGKTASSVRAVVGFSVLLAGEMLDESYDLPSASAAAGLILLIRSPRLLFQAGFQLSFLAVVGIGLLYPVLKEHFRPGHLGNAFLFGLSVQIATLPAVTAHFYEYPAAGLILNLMAVPLLPAVVGVGAAGLVLGAVSRPGGALILTPVHLFLRLLCFAGEEAARLPGGLVRTGCPAVFGILCFAVFWLLVFFRLGKWRKNKGWFRLMGLFFLSLVFLHRPAPSGLTVICLDVGQGDCAFLRFPSGVTMLIDGGSSDVKEVGEYRILPFLKYMGISRIDYLAVTHMDEDHKNGIESFLAGEEMDIGEVLLSEVSGGKDEERQQWKEAWLERRIRVSELSAGMEWRDASGAELVCCYPGPGTEVTEENDASLVLLLTYQDFSALFTGDLGEEKEREVLAFVPELSLTFLKVAHHGSRYSTGEAFLEAFKPELAVISCGEGNRYGHPHEELLERLLGIGCQVRVTAEDGACCLNTDGERVRVRIYGKGR